MNRKGETPENLITEEAIAKMDISYQNDVGQDSLTRFDDKKSLNKRKKKKNRNPRN
jgi:hypothetical protein